MALWDCQQPNLTATQIAAPVLLHLFGRALWRCDLYSQASDLGAAPGFCAQASEKALGCCVLHAQVPDFEDGLWRCALDCQAPD